MDWQAVGGGQRGSWGDCGVRDAREALHKFRGRAASKIVTGQARGFNDTLRSNLAATGPAGAWYQAMRSRLNPTAVRYVDGLLMRID
jgi:hypothetical protein